MDQQAQLDEKWLEKIHVMEAVVGTEAGVSFLQWLCRLTGFNKSIMSLEDASRRDIWLTVRQFIDVKKLSEIEHVDLRQQQEMAREMLEELGGMSNE